MATNKPIFTTSEHSANTLAEQLLRIKDYINLLRLQAAYLGDSTVNDKLKEISDTVSNNPAPNLAAITEALLEIEKKLPTLDSVPAALGEDHKISGKDEELVIRIPKGYYGKDTTFTIESLSDSSKVTAAPAVDEVVIGKDYWVNGDHKTGTLVDNSKQTVEATSNNTGGEGENALKSGDHITVTVPKAKYDEESVIDTGIIARTRYDVQAEVEVSTDSEGADHATLKTITLDPGYYDRPIVVTPKFSDGGTYESIINVSELTVNNSGTYNPHSANFDYYSTVRVDAAEIKSSADLNIPTAKVTVAVQHLGYTDETSYEVSIPTQTAPNAVDQTTSTETANVTVTPKPTAELSVTVPAGMYTEDTVISILPMSSGDKVTSDNISVKDGAPVENASKNGYTVNVAVDKSGYIAAGDYVASDLAKSVISLTNVTDNVIQDSVIVVSSNEGYTEGEVKELSVQQATFTGSNIGVAPNTITLTPTQKGWFEGNTFNVTGQVSTIVEGIAETSDVTVLYSDVATLTNGINTKSWPGGEGKYYKKVETDFTVLVSELAGL